MAGLLADELAKEPRNCAGGFARFWLAPTTFQDPGKQGSGQTSSRFRCRTEGWPESNEFGELQCLGGFFGNEEEKE